MSEKGFMVREVGGLRGWYCKKRNKGVYLDSSASRARVYPTKVGAASACKMLTKLGFKYRDGTDYVFEVVPANPNFDGQKKN